jgi:hypothetical protein
MHVILLDLLVLTGPTTGNSRIPEHMQTAVCAAFAAVSAAGTVVGAAGTAVECGSLAADFVAR